MRGAAAATCAKAVAAALVSLAGLACGGPRYETAASAEAAVLLRQQAGLRALIAAAEKGSLLPFDDIVVALDQDLVQRLVRAVLPLERLVGGKYRIRLTAADVTFENGLALVRLDGRASLAEWTEGDAVAEVRLYSALDLVELDAATGVLRGRVTLIALDARRVDVMGMRSEVGEGLVEELGRERLDTFAALASSIEIPVKLDREIVLPQVGTAGGVRIDRASIPLRATVADVKAFRGRLWICIRADVEKAGTGTAPS